MSKRTHRATSKAAHESVKEHKAAMYEKILQGLYRLRVGGNFEELAKAAGIEPQQCWKRLSEMQRSGLIFTTGITRATSSGRQAMVWQATEIQPPKSSFTPTERGIQDLFHDRKEDVSRETMTQKRLFP